MPINSQDFYNTGVNDDDDLDFMWPIAVSDNTRVNYDDDDDDDFMWPLAFLGVTGAAAAIKLIASKIQRKTGLPIEAAIKAAEKYVNNYRYRKIPQSALHSMPGGSPKARQEFSQSQRDYIANWLKSQSKEPVLRPGEYYHSYTDRKIRNPDTPGPWPYKKTDYGHLTKVEPVPPLTNDPNNVWLRIYSGQQPAPDWKSIGLNKKEPVTGPARWEWKY